MQPPVRQPRGKAADRAWQWDRSADTRQALLDAARDVFIEQGFADTVISDVVERAGSSVGSVYHHFGGKSELFMELWLEYQQAREEVTSQAVAQAREAGVTDLLELFAAGMRAFLEVCWQRRDLTRLFYSGDGPAGFDVMKRQRSREWVRQNDTLLQLSDTTFDRLYGSILYSLIAGLGAREVAEARTRPQASRIIDAVLEYVRRLMTGGPWQPVRPADNAGAGRRAPARRAAK